MRFWRLESFGTASHGRGTLMAERRLTMLQYIGKTPSFAMCEKCLLKFFTPRELTKKPLEAEANLREKFDLHECKVLPRPA
jgi:hypothetical protein